MMKKLQSNHHDEIVLMKMMKYAQMLNCSFILEDFTDWLTYFIVLVHLTVSITSENSPLSRASLPRRRAVRRGLATWTRGSGAGAGAEEAGVERRRNTARDRRTVMDWDEKYYLIIYLFLFSI